MVAARGEELVFGSLRLVGARHAGLLIERLFGGAGLVTSRDGFLRADGFQDGLVDFDSLGPQVLVRE